MDYILWEHCLGDLMWNDPTICFIYVRPRTPTVTKAKSDSALESGPTSNSKNVIFT